MGVTNWDAMRRALALAKKGHGKVYPNPMVGAVVVKEGEIIGEGWHQGPGRPHAEVEALKSCIVDPAGAKIFVTLEPCNHFGRTPPCTEAIIRAGLVEVHYAVADPNPNVAGSGAQRLKQAGIHVEEGLREQEALSLNREFFHHCLTDSPWVVMKAGMSLDGKIAMADGESKWITGPGSRRQVHRLRSRIGAVLIGIGTAQKDDPLLSTRLKGIGYHQPLKVVLDGKLSLSLESRLVAESPELLVVFCTQEAPEQKERELIDRGVRVHRQAGKGRVNPVEVLGTLGGLGIQSVLVEGGHEVYASFVELGLVHEYYLFYAPFLMGGENSIGVVGGVGITSLEKAPRLKIESIKRYGEDILIHAWGKGGAPYCLRDWSVKSDESQENK